MEIIRRASPALSDQTFALVTNKRHWRPMANAQATRRNSTAQARLILAPKETENPNRDDEDIRAP